jgi:hypothetical protein
MPTTPITCTDDHFEDEDQTKTEVFICASCDAVVPMDDANTGPRGTLLCEDCYNGETVNCDHDRCGEICWREDAVMIPFGRRELFFCSESCARESGYIQCEECGDWGVSGNGYMYEGDYYCEGCYDNLFGTCPNCSEVYPHSELREYEDTEEERYCDRCIECFQRGEDSPHSRNPRRLNINSYGYKPIPLFHGTGPQQGMEIEVDCFPSYEKLEEAAAVLAVNDPEQKNYYLKTDGSLDQGFEIVFHPRDMASWIAYKPNLDFILGTVRDHGGKAFKTDTCGLHIHHENRRISDTHTVRLVSFVYKCRQQIQKVAQRKANTYAQYSWIVDLTGDDLRQVYKSIKYQKAHQNRYSALNLENRNTIETRIFKSTLATDSVLSYLAFNATMFEYFSGKYSPTIGEIIAGSPDSIWADFFHYVKKTVRDQAPGALNLMAYLNHKKLNPTEEAEKAAERIRK